MKVGAGCGWKKKQYHKEKEDSLKAVTVLRGNELYRRCAGTQVQAWNLQIDKGHRNGKQQDIKFSLNLSFKEEDQPFPTYCPIYFL